MFGGRGMQEGRSEEHRILEGWDKVVRDCDRSYTVWNSWPKSKEDKWSITSIPVRKQCLISPFSFKSIPQQLTALQIQYGTFNMQWPGCVTSSFSTTPSGSEFQCPQPFSCKLFSWLSIQCFYQLLSIYAWWFLIPWQSKINTAYSFHLGPT